MDERMTDDDLVAAWDDGRRGAIWDELVRARESEKRLAKLLDSASSTYDFSGNRICRWCERWPHSEHCETGRALAEVKDE